MESAESDTRPAVRPSETERDPGKPEAVAADGREGALSLPGFTLDPGVADISDVTEAIGAWLESNGGGGAISAGRGYVVEQTEDARAAAASAILRGTAEGMDRDAAIRALGPAAALSGDLGMAKLAAAAYGAPVEDMGGWAGCGKFACGRGFFIDWRLADAAAVAAACRAAGLRAFAPEG